jgi:hypothetical protein
MERVFLITERQKGRKDSLIKKEEFIVAKERNVFAVEELLNE